MYDVLTPPHVGVAFSCVSDDTGQTRMRFVFDLWAMVVDCACLAIDAGKRLLRRHASRP
jgi:hypothetical protein